MKGSARDIQNPLQSILKNSYDFIRRAEKNRVKLQLANLAWLGDTGKIAEVVGDKSPNVHKTITFYENGRRKYLEVEDEGVVRAINDIDNRTQATWVARAIRASTGVIRAAMTAVSPDYSVGNVFRDIPDAFIHNKYGKKNPFTAALYAWDGLMSMIHKDKDYYEYMVNGGAMAAFVSEDRDHMQANIDSMLKTNKEQWLGSGVKGFFSKLLDSMQKFSEYSEYATRIGVYKQTKAALAERNTDKKATKADMREAALMSREATLDFARAGRTMRTLNKGIAFSNAAVQGFDRFCRTFDLKKLKTAEGRKEFGQAAFRLAMTSILPTMALFFLNHDKDWWKELPDWQKETYWNLGEGFRIPKGQDFGLKFMSFLTEQYLNWTADNKPVEFQRLKRLFIDALPSLMPSFMAPMVENATNYSFFRDAPIVPAKLQHMPAHMQYDAYTSGFAKTVGEITGFSPKKIDNLISGYFGFMGRFTLQGYDMTLGNKQLDLAPENLPMVRRFLFDPLKNPKSVKDYYEAYEEQTQLYNEYKTTHKKPEGFDPRLYNRLKSIKADLQTISKKEQAIINNANLSVDEKKRKLHELEKRRIEKIQRVMKR